jgi:hypothetical protein
MSKAPTIDAALALINGQLTARGYTRLDSEQVAALRSRTAPGEAIGMLDDLRDRVQGIDEGTHRTAVEAVLANTQLSAEQRAFMEARLLQIVNTVGAHVVAGEPFYPGGKVPPVTLTGFGELHDYCDANELGGLCDDAITEEANRLFPGRTDAETVATQEWMQISDRIQTLADEWIVNAQGVFQSGQWWDRTTLVGKDREALPAFCELEVDVPLGWWGVTGPNDGCPNFSCGYYRLWIDSKQSALSGGTPQFTLELLDEDTEQVCVILATDDWIDMQACIATLPSSREYLEIERGRAASRHNAEQGSR